MLARDLRKQWNMKKTVIPIIVGALGTVLEGLKKSRVELDIRGKTNTVQTTSRFKWA